MVRWTAWWLSAGVLITWYNQAFYPPHRSLGIPCYQDAWKYLKKNQSRHQWYYNVQHILTFLGLINDLMIHWPFCSHHLPDIHSNVSPNDDVKIRFLFSPYIHVFNCTLDKACLILVRVMEYICLEVITYVVCKLLWICIIEFIIFLSLHPNNVWRN